jgi:uncharacterized protein HemX
MCENPQPINAYGMPSMNQFLLRALSFAAPLTAACVLILAALSLAGCGAGGTATQAAAEAQAAKAAKQNLDSAKAQIKAAEQLDNQRLKQAESQ